MEGRELAIKSTNNTNRIQETWLGKLSAEYFSNGTLFDAGPEESGPSPTNHVHVWEWNARLDTSGQESCRSLHCREIHRAETWRTTNRNTKVAFAFFILAPFMSWLNIFALNSKLFKYVYTKISRYSHLGWQLNKSTYYSRLNSRLLLFRA